MITPKETAELERMNEAQCGCCALGWLLGSAFGLFKHLPLFVALISTGYIGAMIGLVAGTFLFCWCGYDRAARLADPSPNAGGGGAG